jgi:tetratricopeptide (TPR) repeat protein
MTPNKADASGDPWYYPRRLLRESLAEADAWPPPEGAHRESAFLEAVASLNLSKYAEEHGKDEEAARFRRSAEVRLTAMPSLPWLAPESAEAVPDFVEEGARLYFEALLQVASDDMPGSIERLEAAAATVTSFWSDLARERLPGVRLAVDKGERDEKAMKALDRFIEALEGEDRDSELEALEALEPFRSDLPWLDREWNFLLVATRKTLEPPAILQALRDFPGDSELSSLAREAAGRCAERGEPAEAMALLETQGPLEDWSPEDLQLYATLAEKVGKLSTQGRALTILARYDCGKAPRAAEVLQSLGQRNKAIRILREELGTDCRNLEHRWQAWEVSRGTGDSRLERQAGGLLLGTLRADDPRRPLVEQRVAALMAEEQRSHAEKVSEEALLAAARGDWSDVERRLDGFEGSSLRPDVLEAWARSKAEAGKWGEAARLYGLLGDEPDWAWRTAECHLRAGDVSTAHGVIRRLQERARDEGGSLSPPKAAPPDLEALITLSAGDLIGASKSTTSPAVLREILQESVRLQDGAAELLVLGKLEGWGKLEKGEPERLRHLWRSRLGIHKGRMIVLCDTNVLVSLTLQRLKTTHWLGLRSREDIVARVDALRKRNDLVVVSPAVRAEFLRVVHSPPEKGPPEAFQQLLKESREVLSGAALKEAVGQDIRASQRHLAEIHHFFSRQEIVKRSRVLTRLKIRDRPEMAEIIASRREGKVDGGEASSVAMPELGDRWLMVEAIRVSELMLPGFYGVGILSDDRDFREFRSEIQREFGITVLGAM